MSETANKFSFAELIGLYRIEIPIIQRDYAQGRNNSKSKSIRDAFVSDLYSALCQPSETKKPLELAFIYGRVENGVFVPVDGQQRLTTLYLLHLYLVKCCMAIEATCDWCPHGNLLARFTYAIRQSSREFCESIVLPDKQIIPVAGENLKAFVEEQPWFYVEWKFDPTISGMLEVLDVIHKKFNKDAIGKKKERCVELLSSLYGKECPIQFHFLDMGHHSLTDDLYLKMNARGLPLTAFENLKCTIENYFSNPKVAKDSFQKLSPIQGKSGYEERPWTEYDPKSIGKRFSTLCDHAWLDFFWHIESYSSESDGTLPAKCNASMMVIIARLVALYAFEKDIFLDKKGGVSENGYEKALEYKKQIDENLLNIRGKEDFIPFGWFRDVFKWTGVDRRPEDVISYVVIRLNRMALYWDKMAEGLMPYWDNKDTNVKDANKSWSTFFCKVKGGKEWKLYAALHAVLSFLDYKKEWDKSDEFAEWMRVQWNIIENSSIDSFEQMERYVKFCSSLVDSLRNTECQSVLKYLAERQGESSAFKEQVKEEVIKAILICGKGGENANRNAILEAERLPWFRGRISAIIADDGIIDNDLKSWFSKENVGEVNSQYRQAWVKKVVRCIEQEYNAATDKPWVYFPVRSIIIGDASLKEAIYNKTQSGWIVKARNVQLDPSASVWIKRMAGDDKEENESWKNRICISSYRGGDVYAYRGAYITGAYRLDEKINWWYVFISKAGARASCQTNEKGTWIQCEITSGHYKGVYALCHDGTASFAQKKMNDHGWYPPSNEEAKKIWEAIVDITDQDWVTNLLEELNQKQS
jgi:hypothetical protein